jgi:putative dimethyl sulfoxide reductase chaperone
MADTVGDRDAARADLARLLAACYYEPGAEFAEERVFDAIVGAATIVDAELAGMARRLAEAFGAARLEDLLIDYTRLFLGPAKALAQPYGSAWLEADGGLMQDSTLAVATLYAEGGFEIAEEFRDLPDHVAAELEFLYLLLFKLAQARMSGDSEVANTADALRRQFLDRHLGAWVGPFAGAVRAGAQTDFYRALAALTERFVGLEARA